MGTAGTVWLVGCQGTDDGSAPTASTSSEAADTPTDEALAVVSTEFADGAVIGSATRLTVGVTNDGDQPAEFDVRLSVAGESVVGSTVQLDPGSTETVTGTFVPMTVGELPVSVNGDDVATLGVVPAATKADRTVGAHYFSWYGTPPHTWRGGDWSLESPYTPVLGNYDVGDPDVVAQHIDWCHYAGISWLTAVWTGPKSATDRTLGDHVLDHPRAGELDWSIFYDSFNVFSAERSGIDLDNPDHRGRIRDHVAYFAEEFFDRDLYKTIDGRPAFYVYTAGTYEGDVTGAFTDAFQDAGVDPYLIADVGTRRMLETVELVDIADAVTLYNPYTPAEDITETFYDDYEALLESWDLQREYADVDVLPTAIPGFDDSAITHVYRDNPVLDVTERRFRRCCDLASDYADGPVFVSSFNEWYESTFVEPSETFGRAFLDTVREELLGGEYDPRTREGTMVTFEFGRTVDERDLNPDAAGNRPLTMMVSAFELLDANGNRLLRTDVGEDADRVRFLKGAFSPYSPGPDAETRRWFGGGTESVVFFEGVEDVAGVAVTGSPAAEMDLTVRVGDETLGSKTVTGDRTYAFE